MQETFSCLIGITQCVNIDGAQMVGSIVRWYEILTLAGIVLAISEFIENKKFKIYIFKHTKLGKSIFTFFLFSISLVFVANILPLIPGQAILIFGYPSFWEFLSLLCFTIGLSGVLFFTLSPRLFIPKWDRNADSIIDIIRNAIHYDASNESFRAISFILHWNLDKILLSLSKKPKNVSLALKSSILLDEILSNGNFCRYLATNDIGLLLDLINATKKAKVWDYDINHGGILFNSITRELFTSNSLLDKELEHRGVGLSRPVFNALFSSLEIINNYHIFQSIRPWDREILTESLLKKYVTALEISLRKYFSEDQSVTNVSVALSVAIENAVEMFDGLINEGRKHDFSGWNHPYGQELNQVAHFFNEIGDILMGYGVSTPPKIPILGEDDKNLSKNSLTKGIADALFQYLDALTHLQSSDYARFLACNISWVMYDNGNELKIISSIRTELLAQLKKRVEENKKGYYSSMVKLLFEIYGFEFDSGIDESNIIGKYIEKEFLNYFQNLAFDDPKATKEFLPDFWEIKNNKIFDRRGGLIFEKK